MLTFMIAFFRPLSKTYDHAGVDGDEYCFKYRVLPSSIAHVLRRLNGAKVAS